MTRMGTDEGKGIDRGGKGKRMMARVRNIAHGDRRTTMKQATNTAHGRQRMRKAVGVIIGGLSAMLPQTKTTTAGEKMIDRDEIVRKKIQADDSRSDERRRRHD